MAFNSFSLCLLICLVGLQAESALTQGGRGHTEVKKILIIGATGHAGSKMVKEAVDRGLQVRAFCRHPSRLSEDVIDKVELEVGDIHNYDDVRKAVKGVDAVIVAISSISFDDTTNYKTRGLKNVVKAMKEEKVEIINVLLSVFMFVKTEDIPLFFANEANDENSMYDVLKNSDLKYIGTCPPNFEQNTYDGYETKIDGMPGGNFNGGDNVISLNQLAKVFLDSLSEPKYYRHLVGVRNKLHHKSEVKV